jgi:hypothetical protein
MFRVYGKFFTALRNLADRKATIGGTRVALTTGMTSNVITQVFAVLLGCLFLGTVGVFLMAVPLLSLVSVILLLVGMMLMFALGLHAGGRRIRIPRRNSLRAG